jgi:transposase
VARRHAVNANQVFFWRKKYHEGQLGKGPSSKLLSVTLSDSTCGKSASLSSAVGSLEIKLSKGTVRVAGNVDVVMLRTAIESLLG